MCSACVLIITEHVLNAHVNITVVTVVLKPVSQRLHKNTCGMVSFHTCDVSKGSFPLSSSWRATSSCNTQEWQIIGKEHFICKHYKKHCFISVYMWTPSVWIRILSTATVPHILWTAEDFCVYLKWINPVSLIDIL